MKSKFLLIAILGMLYGVIPAQHVIAQNMDYKVVFDLTSPDTADHHSLVRWLDEISKNNPNAQLEVVFYGKSLSMVTTGKSDVAEEINVLTKNKNISFRVCSIALKRHQLTKSNLLHGVETVPDGIAEIVKKQGEGWAYIKAGR